MEMLLPLAILLAVSVGCYLCARASKHILLKVLLWIVGGAFGAIFILLLLLTGFFWEQEPPSITRLATAFPERRAALEQILAMSNQDTHFSRIDPTFVNYGYIDGTPYGQALQGQGNSPLPDERWNSYRSLFKKIKLQQGLERDADGNVYFRSGAVGLLNRGHSTGYLYCRDAGSNSSQKSSFEPCTLSHRDSGSQSFSMEPRGEAYSFMKVADHWFVFDQGPS